MRVENVKLTRAAYGWKATYDLGRYTGLVLEVGKHDLEQVLDDLAPWFRIERSEIKVEQ